MASSNNYNNLYTFTSDAMMINELFLLKRTKINSLKINKAAILKLSSNDLV